MVTTSTIMNKNLTLYNRFEMAGIKIQDMDKQF